MTSDMELSVDRYRTKRGVDFLDVHTAAHRAGMEAGQAARPDPMVVIDPSVRRYSVPDGPCGFAWVRFPNRGKFAQWALASGLAKKSIVHPGLIIRVHEFGQSIDRKEAYAQAYAESLHAALGIDATYGSRLD